MSRFSVTPWSHISGLRLGSLVKCFSLLARICMLNRLGQLLIDLDVSFYGLRKG